MRTHLTKTSAATTPRDKGGRYGTPSTLTPLLPQCRSPCHLPRCAMEHLYAYCIYFYYSLLQRRPVIFLPGTAGLEAARRGSAGSLARCLAVAWACALSYHQSSHQSSHQRHALCWWCSRRAQAQSPKHRGHRTAKG